MRPVLPRYTSATFIDSIAYLHAKLFSPEAKYIPQFLGSVFSSSFPLLKRSLDQNRAYVFDLGFQALVDRLSFVIRHPHWQSHSLKLASFLTHFPSTASHYQDKTLLSLRQLPKGIRARTVIRTNMTDVYPSPSHIS